jgi:hypothetical protein
LSTLKIYVRGFVHTKEILRCGILDVGFCPTFIIFTYLTNSPCYMYTYTVYLVSMIFCVTGYQLQLTVAGSDGGTSEEHDNSKPENVLTPSWTDPSPRKHSLIFILDIYIIFCSKYLSLLPNNFIVLPN